jgi:hypothetical protein
MFRSHLLPRFATTLLMVVSLLFAQVASATCVCAAAADQVAMAKMMASGQPCDGMDAAQPVPCHLQGAAVSPTFEVVKVASAWLPAIVQMLVVPLVLDPADAAALAVAASVPVRPPPDPVFLATLRLRV